jgi:hypothetical protein
MLRGQDRETGLRKLSAACRSLLGMWPRAQVPGRESREANLQRLPRQSLQIADRDVLGVRT